MDIVFTICIGSAIQTALVVAPVLVLASWLMGEPMNLVFSSPLDLFAIAGAAFIVRSVAADGEITWFEGLLLVGVYLLFALAYSGTRADARNRAARPRISRPNFRLGRFGPRRGSTGRPCGSTR